MTIQRIGSTEGVKEVYGIKVVPLISLVVVHNGIVSTCGVTAEPTGDVRVQTKKVLETIDRLLQQAAPVQEKHTQEPQKSQAKQEPTGKNQSKASKDDQPPKDKP